MIGQSALSLGILAWLSGVAACGVVDVNRPGPPPPCPTDSATPARPPPRATARPAGDAPPRLDTPAP